MEKRPTKEEKELVLKLFRKALDENNAELFFTAINAMIGFAFLSASEDVKNKE